jgi:hypothetical protein
VTVLNEFGVGPILPGRRSLCFKPVKVFWTPGGSGMAGLASFMFWLHEINAREITNKRGVTVFINRSGLMLASRCAESRL